MEPTTSAQASVAADEGTLKRSIQMKMFATKADKAKVQLAFEDDKSPTRGNAMASAITVGQIIGVIYAVKEQQGTLPDGTAKMSLLAIGDFEATNYSTGEVFTSTAAYLPGYYLETAQEILKHPASTGFLEFAIEIVIVPTGKSIPIAYEVRNLIRRRPENPLNRLKLELQAANRLRLPAPTVVDMAPIAGEILTIGGPETSAEPEAGEEQPAEGGDVGEEGGEPEPNPAEVEAAVEAGRKAKARVPA